MDTQSEPELDFAEMGGWIGGDNETSSGGSN